MEHSLTASTKYNLQRVDDIIEQSFKLGDNGLPLPSWIELSIIDYCNRKCVFCPRSNTVATPNQKHLYMTTELATKIANDLKKLSFNGVLLLAGYGEPMASPVFSELVKIFSPICRVEVVTNGDFLTIENIQDMFSKGLSFLSVSIYSNQKRFDVVKEMIDKCNLQPESYILRDRWHSVDDDYGVKLTNRAGLVSIGNQPEINLTTECYYPFYSMTVDWNGDVYLCPQDWHRRSKLGNLSINSVSDVWYGEGYEQYRKTLYAGKRCLFPCNGCNADGKCHGKTHADGFMK